MDAQSSRLFTTLRWFALAAGFPLLFSCGGSAKSPMRSVMSPDVADASMAEQAEAPGGGGSAETWKRSTLEANTSQLMVGDNESLPIRGMQVHTRVDGFRARVLIDFSFFNSYDRQFEGTFKLRLPEGATPYFLAFGQSRFEAGTSANEAAIAYTPTEQVREQTFAPADIVAVRADEWDDVKVARMVEREKAAIAYGETTRRQIDPALLEWAGAGVFNARVFPIAPQRLHRVVVGYDMNLTRIGDDLELQLPIPADVPSSAVDISVAAMDGVAVSMTPTPADTATAKGLSHVRMDDVQGQVLTIRLAGAGDVAIAGADVMTGPHFAARFAPVIPAETATAAADHAVLVIDRSMSSNPDKFNVWRLLAKALLDENRGTLNKFAVLFFNIETHWWQEQFVNNTPDNVAALMAFVDELSLEGATDVGAALSEAAAPAWSSNPAPYNVFMLSDGAATWGESEAYAISNGIDTDHIDGVFAYRTGMAGTDSDMLDHVARESGGAVFSVVGESEIASAAVAHAARPWLLDKIEVAGASDILVAGRPQALFPGQRLFIAGRGVLEPGAKVAVHIHRGDDARTITASLPHVIDSELAPRAYGQLAVGQIEEFLGTTQSFAEAYARHYRVTGKSTSLLMLESEQEYQRFGISEKKDAAVIMDTTATQITAAAIEEMGELLGDPKAAFLTLERLPDDVRALLATVASSEFRVTVPRLVAKNHTRKGMPANIASDLKQRTPGYDDTSTEAERRKAKHGAADALVALSSLVEANPGDSVLARDVGFTAARWGMHAHAYHLFRRVAQARPFEPQTYRALALTLAELDRAALALAYFEIALGGEWDARFGAFREIVALDYLRFLRTDIGKLPKTLRDHATARAKTLKNELGIDRADVLVTITWNTDNTDVDLHVIEPSGEEVFYSHPTSKSGGRLTRDVTQGYGPEMYVLPIAPRGKFTVRANYFASDASRASTRSKVYATVYRNWGTDSETVEHQVVTLAIGKDMHEIAVFNVK